MRRAIKTTFLFLILSGVVGSLSAQPQNRWNMQPQQNRQIAQNERAQGQQMRLPNLTDEQKEQIKAIRLNGQKEALPLRNELMEKKARLRTLTTSEDYNEKSVNNTIDDISELEASLMKLRQNHRQEVREILTEEQRIVFDSASQRGKRKGNNNQRGKRGRR
ncbi:MAG: periplasmic heavy metal sensor [Balneolaceae bacterium]